jgi:uncharacterized membrane protein
MVGVEGAGPGRGQGLSERLPSAAPAAAEPHWAALPVGLLAVVLLATGLGKLMDPQGFAAILCGYRLPHGLVLPGVAVLAFVELLAAVALLLADRRRHIALASLVLLALNIAVLAAALCRCVTMAHQAELGADLPHAFDLFSLVSAIAMLALALSLLKARRRIGGTA